MASAPPPPRPPRDTSGDGDEDCQSRPGTAAAAAAAGAGAAQAPAFRYWVDELLWSQGRQATVTIEEVLERLGGQRTGGPHKPPPAAKLPDNQQQQQQQQQHQGLQQLLQHARLGDQPPEQAHHHHPQRPPATVTAGVVVNAPPLGRRSGGSSGGSMPSSLSSRNSSAGSLDLLGGSPRAGAAGAGEDAPPAAAAELKQARQPLAAAQQPGSAASAAAARGAAPGGDGDGDDAARSPAAAATAAAVASAGSGSEEPQELAGGALLAPTKRPDDPLLGYHHVRAWDLLWTKSVYAIRAARQLRPGQVVSAIAGLNCLSMKKRMVQTLRLALGAEAFQIVPLSFCIPEDLPAWQAWLASPQGAAADTGLWMLKTGQDAGKGLRLVHTQHALQVASRPPRPGSKPQHHIKVAQQYVTRPLLLARRKFHLRLWLLVTGHAPLRAYLHGRGLVLFSSEAYDRARPLEGGAGARPSSSHVTNYARNEDTWVWDLDQLAAQLGPQPWAALWRGMKEASGLTAAAVLGQLRAAHRWLQPSVASYGFQMLGLDFLVDEAMHPWLLEVNSAPSIMALHSDPATAGLIKDTKQAMLGDMMAMVGHRLQCGPAGGGGGGGGGGRAHQPPGWREEVAAEMANRGGFEPLMPYFPVQQQQQRRQGAARGDSAGAAGGGGSGGGGIPWQDVDVQLQQLLRQQYAGLW